MNISGNIVKVMLGIGCIGMSCTQEPKFEELKATAHLTPEMLTWGKVQSAGKQKLVAGAKENLNIEITLTQAIEPGHSIETFVHFVSDMQTFQHENPDKPAYYSCQADIDKYEVFTERNPRVHGRGTFFPYRRYAGIRLHSGAEKGSRLSFTIKDVSMQTYEETLFNLRFAIVKDDIITGYLGDAFYEVVGGEPSQLALFAPTCMEMGEQTKVNIIIKDKYRNKTGAAINDEGFTISLVGSPEKPEFQNISYEKEYNHHVIEGLQFDKEGVYYLEAVLQSDKTMKGMSNPIIVRKKWDKKVYWGELHQHSYLADGRGTPANNYNYAISTGCLDFCSVSAHQEMLYRPGMLRIENAPIQKGWEELIWAAKKFNGDDLITMLGSEVGGPLKNKTGHMNSYYLNVSNRPELERIGKHHDQSTRTRPEITNFDEYLNTLMNSKGDWLLIPHAHAGVGQRKYKVPKVPEHMTNLEIVSMHGIFEKYYQGWLAAGHIMGVNGGGDCHMPNTGNANPGNHYANMNGLAAAVAGEKTRKGIWEAFKTRKTYAVTHYQRIYLEFSSEKAGMGEVCRDTESSRIFRTQIAGTAPILKVELFKNGQRYKTYRPRLDIRKHIRLVWHDDITGRRTDDSRTRGFISANGSKLSKIKEINAFIETDSFKQVTDGIHYRSNAYSGVMKGVILEPEENISGIKFVIKDEIRGNKLIDSVFNISLSRNSQQYNATLIQDYTNHFDFTKGAHLYIRADWIDTSWPKMANIQWEDKGGSEDYYYVRVEQIDGNMAWSSPIWFRK